MHFGRVLSLVLFIIVFSLLQLWVLLVVLHANDVPINAKEVLGDGGLLFFATSLCVSSAVRLYDSRSIKFGDSDFVITSLVCGVGLIYVVVHYAAVLSHEGMATANPFGKNIQMQIGCAVLAVGYWFFAGKRTNLFIKDEGRDA